jgi:polyhydroxyalkanoate synthase subunit PhaC
MLRNQTQHEPARLVAALAGLRAYQAAPRPAAVRPMPAIATAGRAVLRDYGGDGRHVVIVPSLINGPEVLDLLPDNSLLRWLASQRLRPLMVDWGTPGPEDRALSIADHVETMLLPLIEAAGPDAALAGYCLGGTMALAAAAIRPPSALAMIAAPWHFSGFPDEARTGLADLWRETRPMAESLGLLPLEVLQTGFWRLDPKRTIDKFVTFGRGERSEAATRSFVALEDWANDGPALTLGAGRELLEDIFLDDLPGQGGWRVAGHTINPPALTCPVLDIVSTTDRIVPAASAVGAGIAHARRITLTQGHVGMMVGGRALAALWEPLAEWLRNPHIA